MNVEYVYMSKKKEIHDILSHCSKMIKKELTL